MPAAKFFARRGLDPINHFPDGHQLARQAYLIYFRVLATAGPSNLLLVTFLIPLSAILLGVMVLGEQLEWNAFVGMGLIFIGMIAIDGRILKRFKRKEVWYYSIW